MKEYGTETTRHFWARTYEGNQNNHYQYRGMIGEDEDEILISKLNKEKDIYSKVLVEGIELVENDLKYRENEYKEENKLQNQNESQNGMSGLTSIKEKVYEEDNTYETDCCETTNINTQHNTQENDSNTNPNQRNRKKIEENSEREENNENINENSSRISGFTSLLEENSLTTNIWEVTEQEKAAEKIRNDKAKKVKRTLAQFNVSSKEVVEWT